MENLLGTDLNLLVFWRITFDTSLKETITNMNHFIFDKIYENQNLE